MQTIERTVGPVLAALFLVTLLVGATLLPMSVR